MSNQPKTNDVYVIELVNRSPSNTVLKGTENSDNPIVLDCAGRYQILPRIRIVDKKGSVRRIRHIARASSIFEEDQDKKKEVFNLMTDAIVIEGGRMFIIENPETKATIEFLRSTPQNANSLYPNDRILPIFREIRKEETTSNTLLTAKMQADAMQIVGRLYEATDKGTVYHEDRIKFFATLFNIHGSEDIGDVCLALVSVAQSQPEMFMNTIADKNKEVIINIRAAKELGVLLFAGNQAVMTNGNRPIYSFTSKDDAKSGDSKREAELADFFQVEEGSELYSSLRVELAAAKEANI